MKIILKILIISLTLNLCGCDYNQLQSVDEQIKASRSEMLNQHQRRADWAPNLVSTLKDVVIIAGVISLLFTFLSGGRTTALLLGGFGARRGELGGGGGFGGGGVSGKW